MTQSHLIVKEEGIKHKKIHCNENNDIEITIAYLVWITGATDKEIRNIYNEIRYGKKMH